MLLSGGGSLSPFSLHEPPEVLSTKGVPGALVLPSIPLPAILRLLIEHGLVSLLSDLLSFPEVFKSALQPATPVVHPVDLPEEGV